jgi:hypothetical protein
MVILFLTKFCGGAGGTPTGPSYADVARRVL